MSDWVAAWLDIYEQWEADPEPAHDAEWVERLATAGTLAGMPCYEDGVDAGAAGWRRWAANYRGVGLHGQEVKQEAIDNRTTGNAARALPWEANENSTDDKEKQ